MYDARPAPALLIAAPPSNDFSLPGRSMTLKEDDGGF